MEGWENPKWKSRLENLASGVSLISRKQGKLIPMVRQASEDRRWERLPFSPTLPNSPLWPSLSSIWEPAAR